MSDDLDRKIAHLQMIQGVIGRMAADTQTLKTLAITVAAAIIALGQTTGANTPWLTLVGILPTALFWGLTARTLHVERAYRRLYDKVRKDEPVEPFSMDWRAFATEVDNQLRLAFTPSVILPYLSTMVILIAASAFALGGTGTLKGP